MQLAPFRPTIGRMMILVAVLAMVMAGELARRRWVAGLRPPLSKAQGRAMALAARHLGPRHWAASGSAAFVFQDWSRGYSIYGRDYQRLGDGNRLALGPFAVIWRSPDGRNVRTVTGDLANLDLHPPTASGKGIPKLNLDSARMEGNVVFRDDNSTAKRDDDLVSGALPRVDFDQSSLDRMGGLAVPPSPTKARRVDSRGAGIIRGTPQE